MNIGHIKALALRTKAGSPPRQVACADAIEARGLLGDAHAGRLSPRQLLLAGEGVYRDFALPMHALRENLLLDAETAGLASGSVLRIGSDVLLRLMFQCEACGKLDACRPALSRDIGLRRGVLARVLRGGVIRPGDAVRDEGLLLPAWSDDWRARVIQVLDAVPPGSVIEYRDLARLAGIASTYCRGFPRMIARLGPAYANKAVPAQSALPYPRWRGDGLFDHPPLEVPGL